MSGIIDSKIEDYLKAIYRDTSDEVQHEMEALAEERSFPIVGPLVGRTLGVLARAIGARRVFELGSGYGYSALHFARAVGPDGTVHCTELDRSNIERARAFLSRAGVWDRVTFHEEEARAALRRMGGVWDIIYNDIDKEGYPEVVALAHEHLRVGGLLIADNVLWSGRILEGKDDGKPETAGIKEFTRRLFAHEGFLATVDPTRDGVAIALKVA